MSATISLPFLKTMLASKRVHQTVVLYISLLASLVLGITVSVINTRLLGPQAFGNFKFLQTIWTVGVAFVTFGFFSTGGTLLARHTSRASERNLMGSLLVIACGIAVFFTVVMAVASIPLGYVYGEEIGGKMRLFSVFVFVFPLQVYLQEVLRGANDITNLALFNALPQLLYIPAALAVNRLTGFSLDAALLLYLLGMAVTTVIIVIRSHPGFGSVGPGIREVFGSNRALGLHVYVAVLVTTASTQLSQFSLAYFCDTRLVGIFSLAVTITMPLTMIPNAIATTFFKQFASQDHMPVKVIWTTWGISLATLLGFLAVIKMVILRLYTVQFLEVVPLAYICAIGAILHGVGDVYNRYLLSRGITRILRTNAFQLAVISVVGYLLLVAWLGINGAAITKLLVDIVYLATMVLYYEKQNMSGSLAS